MQTPIFKYQGGREISMAEKSVDVKKELHDAYSRMISRLDIREDSRIVLDAIVDRLENGDTSQKRISASSLNHFFSVCAIYELASENLDGKLSGDEFYSSYSGIIEMGSVYNAILERYEDYDVYRLAKENILLWESEFTSEEKLKGVLVHSRPEMNAAILEALRRANPLEYHRVFIFGREYSGLLGGKTGEAETEKAEGSEENGIRRAAAGLAYIAQNGYGLGAFHSSVVKMACEYLIELDRESPYSAAGLLPSESELGKKLKKKIGSIEAGAEKLSDIFLGMVNCGKTDADVAAGSTLHALDLMDSVIEAFELLDEAKARAESEKLRR